MSNNCFSIDWERAWNSHDLNLILSHYSENIIFRSSKAIPLVGTGEIRGKESLRVYWEQALLRQPDLKFTVLEVFKGYRMMVILYRNHKAVRATETLYFDENGVIIQAAACHQDAVTL